MDKIQKLFRKVGKKDRVAILQMLRRIQERENLPDSKKLKGYDYIFRVRVGNYRIIYYDDGAEIIIKAIKKRDESTYSDF
jgi:mRNA-degrading endonuclease RelE of RelBE toxin-antitoxin system